MANQVKSRKKNKNQKKGQKGQDTKNSKKSKLTKHASCEALKARIKAARTKKARGHALHKYMLCRRGH